MQVNLKPVVHRVVVNPRGEPAGADERLAVEPGPAGNRSELVGCHPGLSAAAAADVDTKLVGARIEALLQRAHDRRRDTRGMPVHAHDRTEGLEPERIAQPREQRRPTVVVEHTFGDCGSERDHPRGQPRRNTAAVQREIGDAGSLHWFILPRIRQLSRLRAHMVTLGLVRRPALAHLSERHADMDAEHTLASLLGVEIQRSGFEEIRERDHAKQLSAVSAAPIIGSDGQRRSDSSRVIRRP
jgi:hypothetical protein